MAGVTVSPVTGLTTTEALGAGHTATFTVCLATQPTADVTVSLSSGDTGEGTVAPATLTFTSGNWDETQLVTVTGVPDGIVDGDQPYMVVTAATSPDTNYDGLAVPDVAVTNLDTDTAALTLALGPTVAEGDTITGTVSRNAPTVADLVVTLASDDTTEATVPATVTVLAGHADATFTLGVVAPDTGERGDDQKLRTLTVRVSATTTPLNGESRTWNVGDPIETIDTSRSHSVAPESATTFSVDASDSDGWTIPGTSGTENDDVTYSWSGPPNGEGHFVGSTTGKSVQWVAPDAIGSYNLTCTVDDVAAIGPDDKPTRDDGAVSVTVPVTVMRNWNVGTPIGIEEVRNDAGTLIETRKSGRMVAPQDQRFDLSSHFLPATPRVRVHSVFACSVEEAKDFDAWTKDSSKGVEEDALPKTYTWSCSNVGAGGGFWVNGALATTATGLSVQFKAPNAETRKIILIERTPDNYHQTYKNEVGYPGVGVSFSDGQKGFSPLNVHGAFGLHPGCPECVHMHWRWVGDLGQRIPRGSPFYAGQPLIPPRVYGTQGWPNSQQTVDIWSDKQLGFHYEGSTSGALKDLYMGHGGFYAPRGINTSSPE